MATGGEGPHAEDTFAKLLRAHATVRGSAPRFPPEGSRPLANLDLGPSLRGDPRHRARPDRARASARRDHRHRRRQPAAALLVDNRGADDRRRSGSRLRRRGGGRNRRGARPFRGHDHRRPGSGAGRQDPLRSRPPAEARAPSCTTSLGAWPIMTSPASRRSLRSRRKAAPRSPIRPSQRASIG